MTLHLLLPGRKRDRRAKSGPRHHRPACRLTLEPLEERCLLSGDPVMFWNEVALHATVVDHGIGAPGLQFGPTRASRALAIVSGAVFDSVNSIHPQYDPYLLQLPAPGTPRSTRPSPRRRTPRWSTSTPTSSRISSPSWRRRSRGSRWSPCWRGSWWAGSSARTTTSCGPTTGRRSTPPATSRRTPTASYRASGAPTRCTPTPPRWAPTGARSLPSSSAAPRSSARPRPPRSPAWRTPRPTSRSRPSGTRTARRPAPAPRTRRTSASSGATTPSRAFARRCASTTRSWRTSPSKRATAWSRTPASSRWSISPRPTRPSPAGTTSSAMPTGGR
jgi:hypothetical protein